MKDDGEHSFDVTDMLIRYQNEIGWTLFWDECLSYEWDSIQQIYQDWIGSKHIGSTWESELII